MNDVSAAPSHPTAREVRRWRRYLADEYAEASVYRDLATRREGEERAILLELADAEGRHAAHWEELLGSRALPRPRPSLRALLFGWLARRFGSVFVLALAQRSESRSRYGQDQDATAAMAADERVHEEVVRSLAARGRARMSGNFRAAVFGANDGLVSNLALILGIGASGASSAVLLLTGLSGLLAGALSMGAGEYVSVRSQRELADASTTSPEVYDVIGDLNVNENELALVYRARGMSAPDAEARAHEVLATLGEGSGRGRPRPQGAVPDDSRELLGSAVGAAGSSFCFFASGALIPVLPYLLGMNGAPAVIVASVLVGVALLCTGGIVGLLSGTSPATRALRQIAIGYGAAAVTYGLGLVFGATVG
ncbi:MAG: VIT1/CCC1 transporter family protein [Cellulomonadaceae bacterium]